MKVLTSIVLAASAVLGQSTDTSAKNEVMTAMNSYKVAWVRGDAATMAKLLGSDLIFTHSEGTIRNQKETIESARVPGPQRVEFLPDTRVQIHGATALVCGHEDVWEDNIVKHLYAIHAWQKTSGVWQMVSRQATLISIDKAELPHK